MPTLSDLIAGLKRQRGAYGHFYSTRGRGLRGAVFALEVGRNLGQPKWYVMFERLPPRGRRDCLQFYVRTKAEALAKLRRLVVSKEWGLTKEPDDAK